MCVFLVVNTYAKRIPFELKTTNNHDYLVSLSNRSNAAAMKLGKYTTFLGTQNFLWFRFYANIMVEMLVYLSLIKYDQVYFREHIFSGILVLLL